MSEITKNVESRIGEFHTTHRHLAHIHVDIVGPLPTFEEYRYLITIINRNTRWPEAILIWQQTAESYVKALTRWVSRQGILQVIKSEWGPTSHPVYGTPLQTVLGQRQYTQWHTTQKPVALSKASLMARCQGRSWRKDLPLGPTGPENVTTHGI
ncbi:uncharacterized protein [Macrobrachium rosenbergii]|uniref:uncharacterized protein n=1 Tax=Macrobrachium rosenbergii TaxID=79674 RepID=UPI0034D44094